MASVTFLNPVPPSLILFRRHGAGRARCRRLLQTARLPFELFKRQAAEINALFDAGEDKSSDDFVRFSEGHALFAR